MTIDGAPAAIGASGWVEKLSGGRFERWQRRWLQVTPDGVAWYENDPAAAASGKAPPDARCTRPLALAGGEVNIAGIVTTVDAAQLPKAADARFHYFAVQYKQPAHTKLYRVPTVAEKAAFVAALQQAVVHVEMQARAADGPLVTKVDIGAVELM